MLQTDDVNALSAAIASQSTNLTFDLNGDGTVSLQDLTYWIHVLKRTTFGDANLDFVADGMDFGLWNENRFTAQSDWSAGNFNGDNVVDVRDYNLWNSAKFSPVDGAQSTVDSGQRTPRAAGAGSRRADEHDVHGLSLVDAVFAQPSRTFNTRFETKPMNRAMHVEGEPATTESLSRLDNLSAAPVGTNTLVESGDSSLALHRTRPLRGHLGELTRSSKGVASVEIDTLWKSGDSPRTP